MASRQIQLNVDADSDVSLLSSAYISGVYIRWWRGTVVERRSLAGELSLSCA